METRLLRRLDLFFRTFSAWDEPAHFALLAPDLVFSGSGSGIRGGSLLDYRGIFHGARDELRIQQVRPIRLYGAWPEVAVLAEIHFAESIGTRGSIDSIWHFVFREDELVQELTVLWNPNGPHTF